jgi:regulator of RNase E activity RraA
VVVVPVSMAEHVIEDGQKHAEWEEFSRMKLMQGESLKRYYPLHPDAEEEYQAWRKTRG